MKKLLFLLFTIAFSLAGFTRDLGILWLISGNNKLDCKKIHLGYNNARIVLTNGERKIIPIELIGSYSLKGKVFTRLPLYKDGKPTGQMEFMELIKKIGEISLYKLEVKDPKSPDNEGKICFYYFYHENRLHLAFDDLEPPDIDFTLESANFHH